MIKEKRIKTSNGGEPSWLAGPTCKKFTATKAHHKERPMLSSEIGPGHPLSLPDFIIALEILNYTKQEEKALWVEQEVVLLTVFVQTVCYNLIESIFKLQQNL